VGGDQGEPAADLPQRERLALAHPDLEPVRKQLADGGFGDPRHGFQPGARRLDVEEQQGSPPGHAGGRAELGTADVLFAGERHRGDAKTQGIGARIPPILERIDDHSDMVPPDRAVTDAGDEKQRRRRNPGEARDSDPLQSERPESHEAADSARHFCKDWRQDALTGAKARAAAAPAAHIARPRQRFSEASSTIHRTSSPNEMPAWAAISGTSEVSVMPG